jgi:transposase InsO family protein
MKQIFLDGFVKGYARPMLYYKSYITHPNYTNSKAIVDFRLEVLQHAEQFGVDSALAAFGVANSTFYLWKQKLAHSRHHSIVALAPVSTAPHTKRRRHYYPFHSEQIIRLRKERNYSIGKAKLKSLLDEICKEQHQKLISESTIGRLIGDLKKSGKLSNPVRLSVNGATGKLREVKPKPKIKKKRRDGYQPRSPGDLVQVDCVTKFIDGVRRYVISAIDYKSSFAYSLAYKTLSSNNARDFFLKLQQVAPFTIVRIQTDNGAEFHKNFMAELDYQKLVHFWNYPRRPQQNGKIERYNRTIQEEFIDYHLDELGGNIDNFNHLLTDWCIYYNTRRPHAAHVQKVAGRKTGIQIPPMRAVIYMLDLGEEQSNMLWTYTTPFTYQTISYTMSLYDLLELVFISALVFIKQ